jgi:hypothetical protein
LPFLLSIINPPLSSYQTLHPFPIFLTVYSHSTPKHTAPTIKQTPLQTCTPTKSVFPSFFFSSAPAIGAPISVATLDTLQLIPSLVPNLDRSGEIDAKAAEGSVTRPAERKPASVRLVYV